MYYILSPKLILSNMNFLCRCQPRLKKKKNLKQQQKTCRLYPNFDNSNDFNRGRGFRSCTLHHRVSTKHSPTNSLTKKNHPHIPAANSVTRWFKAKFFLLFFFFSLGWGRSLITVPNVSDSEPVPAHVPGNAAQWAMGSQEPYDLRPLQKPPPEPGVLLFVSIHRLRVLLILRNDDTAQAVEPLIQEQNS